MFAFNEPGDFWKSNAGMKTYFETLDKIWDNTDNSACKIFAQVIMPSKNCFVAASSKNMPYYSIYQLHEEDAMAKIRKKIDECGIALFWDRLHEIKIQFMPRRFALDIPQLRN